jgi:hypothetical protein
VLSGDETRLRAALESGAQLGSTDFPEVGMSARYDRDYVVALPEGGVARCNPVIRPRGCRSRKLERTRAARGFARRGGGTGVVSGRPQQPCETGESAARRASLDSSDRRKLANPGQRLAVLFPDPLGLAPAVDEVGDRLAVEVQAGRTENESASGALGRGLGKLVRAGGELAQLEHVVT